ERFAGIWQDIKANVIRSISTGYNVYKYQREVTSDNTTPDYKAIDWEPLEISLSPVPADFKSQVGRRHTESHEIIIENHLHVQNMRSDMKTEKQTGFVEQSFSTNGVNANETQIRNEAIRAERVRNLEISNAVRAAKLSDSFA